jgi:hypothetical protein
MGMMLHRHSIPKEVKTEKTVEQPKVVKDTNKKPNKANK